MEGHLTEVSTRRCWLTVPRLNRWCNLSASVLRARTSSRHGLLEALGNARKQAWSCWLAGGLVDSQVPTQSAVRSDTLLVASSSFPDASLDTPTKEKRNEATPYPVVTPPAPRGE